MPVGRLVFIDAIKDISRFGKLDTFVPKVSTAESHDSPEECTIKLKRGIPKEGVTSGSTRDIDIGSASARIYIIVA